MCIIVVHTSCNHIYILMYLPCIVETTLVKIILTLNYNQRVLQSY